MAKGLKLSKDKRHKSSSTLPGNILEGTFSERKLDLNVSSEVHEIFNNAIIKSDNLEGKMDLVKIVKKKLKRRSMTRVADQQMPSDNVPFITVRTQPKKDTSRKARNRRLKSASQDQVIDENQDGEETKAEGKSDLCRGCSHRKYAEGDGMSSGLRAQRIMQGSSIEAVCAENAIDEYSDNDEFVDEEPAMYDENKSIQRRRRSLLNKARSRSVKKNAIQQVIGVQSYDDDPGLLKETAIMNVQNEQTSQYSRRIKYRTHRYERPTIASQMKQNINHRIVFATKTNLIPFISSKSTSPSHNIAVNIQQVLHGVKIQQPSSTIPLTLAHQMGLAQIPGRDTKSDTAVPLDHRGMNAIRNRRQVLRLHTGKSLSYRTLLRIYCEGDGLVARFLRRINRPNRLCSKYLYNKESGDDVTSNKKETKKGLLEFAALLRELENLKKTLNDNSPSEMFHRCEELERQIASLEENMIKGINTNLSSMAAGPGLSSSGNYLISA